MELATQRRWGSAARVGCARAAVLAFIFLLPVTARAQERAAQRDGMFVSVPNTLTGAAVTAIELKVKSALESPQRHLRAIVFDFNPGDLPSSTTASLPCVGLAEYILRLRSERPEIGTFAFVHQDVTGHTVLPVLACGELLMAEGAHLGKALLDPATRTASTLAVYESVARRSRAGDLVVRMIKPELEIHKVKMRGGGVRYLDKKNLEQMLQDKDRGGVLADEGVLPGLEGNDILLDARQARKLGLCSETFDTRMKVAAALKLSPRSLEEDYLVGQTIVAWRIEVRGPVTRAKLDSLKRRINKAIASRANLLILELDSEGGETEDAPSFAQYLRTLKDYDGNLPVTTVAYIPPGRSVGAATYLALGCGRIFMGEGAVLGNFDYLRSLSPEALRPKREMLVRLAGERGYPPELFEAMLDPDLVLYSVHRKTDPNEIRVVRKEAFDRDTGSPDPQWVKDDHLSKMPGEFLKLDAAQAARFGVASEGDLNTVYEADKVDPSKVHAARDDWLDKVAEFFREPLVNVLLVMIGIAGLILELKMPGIGLPGVIAAVCFVLFFWAHSFVGQFTMLAVFLFVLGLVLIGLEVFVLPGFGVTGISGIVLVVTSLVLVTLEGMPETTQDWLNLGTRVSFFGISIVGAIIAAFVVAWYLPHLPYASRLVLTPPGEEGGAGEDPLSPPPEARLALLGAMGVAATTLRPAGKARFGEDYLDVVAEGDYVNAGSRVQVIEIEGNRIVVKEV